MAPVVQTAVIINEHGGHDVMKLVDSHPVPQRKPGELLVRIRSSSVNPVDTAVRAGGIKPKQLPKVLGGDVAGVVEEADEGSKFKVGDPVFALTYGYWDTPEGSYCQYAAVPEEWAAVVPTSVLPLEAAGAVPLVGLTAWQALMAAAPHLGQRCLILAASGGVGHMAVQLAKVLGLYVVGVAGPTNTGYVKELGGDEVVDYKQANYADVYQDQPFDIVVDCMGDTDSCLKVLKPSGHYSHIMNNNSDQQKLDQVKQLHEAGKGPGVSVTLVTPNGHQLGEIAELIAQKKVKVEVAESFPLLEVAIAHQQVETGHTRGKVVLLVD